MRDGERQRVAYDQVRDIMYYLKQVAEATPDDVAVALQADTDAEVRAASLLSNLCLIRAAMADRVNASRVDPY